ncbi:tyrosyl-DNA phosphodiesterase-domain-containing protein [Xylariales sp. PMI_506]|nr:tyrosyl-DNA phosphodiesterase-domain-containing protein [Xylariales sp. PMI_506]
MAGSVVDSDEDADLRRAIALSLEDADSNSAANPLHLISDDDDEDNEDDLEKTPVYRQKKNTEARSQPDQKQLDSGATAEPPRPAGIPGLAGLDRKQMEQERLARLAKRKAPDSEQELQGRPTKAKTGPSPGKITHLGTTPRSKDTARSAETKSLPIQSASTDQRRGKALPFPKGVVKKTWAFGFPRTGDDIKIEEVLQKNELQLAVLSSFQWDEEWMLSKIDISKTKIVCIAYASSKEQQEEMRANVPGNAIRFCFPPMQTMGSMHSKLQLLKFPRYLRIVVPTGNLVSYDWGETGVMENMVFIIDLPEIDDPETRAANKLTFFGQELSYFLRAQGLDDGLVRSLEKYDFSATSRYAFIHTIGTSHVNERWKRTGYPGLGRAVSTLGLTSNGEIELDYIVSSLGSVNNELLTAIYYAARGDDGLKEYQERTAKGKKKAPSSSSFADDKFRIYFPSHETISQSRGGKNSAETICAQLKWWNSDKFPRNAVHDSINVRPGLLLHSKIMFVRPHGSASNEHPVAWGYVGSANLSESAWGRLTKDRQTGTPKLACRNWECGVLLPAHKDPSGLHAAAAAAAADTRAPHSLSVFPGTIPVPIVIPSEPYGRTGSKSPWLFLEN